MIINDKTSSIKKQAKSTLKGKGGQLFSVALIFVFSLMLIPVCGIVILSSKLINPILLIIIMIVFEIVIAGPLLLGFSQILLNNVRGKQWKIPDLFVGFRRFGNSFLLFVWIFGNLVILGLPVILYSSVVGKYVYDGWPFTLTLETILIAFAAIVVFILGLAVPLFHYTRYSQAFFYFVDDSRIKVRAAVNKSIEAMKPNGNRFLYLLLSFAGWVLVIVALFVLLALKISAIISLVFLVVTLSALLVYSGTSHAVFFDKIVK